jgi:hypothetical protein
MTRTGRLKVCGNTALKQGTIQMNPNDGFDLGLMTTRYEIDLVLGADVDPDDTGNTDTAAATLLLKNEIANGEVHVSAADVTRERVSWQH